ncbi:LPS-assembly lipoprotein RlpB [Thiorhodovibrio winogradskyi]|uniref:LPS-assembly lipoprotein LptE n=1 Tax=Thiorhodovibrio winogradskyi TaxID=77007 RepID=A0ABZ0S679_9GAMM|nr:LPS assembly lipoprotein LptE [Thiorhodovibrio winogradskyi]
MMRIKGPRPRATARKWVRRGFSTWGLIMALALLASSCGFQLRGALDIPSEYSPIFIQSGGAVGVAMEERLQSGGLSITQVASEAGLILRVLGQQRSSRVVAVDRSGLALAYGLTYTVTFDALDARGQVVQPPQTLSAVRTFDDNPDVAVLGKQLESNIIYQDLVADVADRILLSLRAALTPQVP